MTTRNPITDQELRVLAGMAAGQSNKEIGAALFVTEDTVKTHARKLFKKLDARDRAHAVAIGFERGLLTGHLASADCIRDTRRIGAAHARLDLWRTARNAAPAGSAFARFYDGLAQALAARPDPPA